MPMRGVPHVDLGWWWPKALKCWNKLLLDLFAGLNDISMFHRVTKYKENST